MRRRSRFERLGRAFETIERAAERKQWHSDPAMNMLRRSCHITILLAAVFGVVLPLVRFEPILLLVIPVALVTIGMAIFAIRAPTAPVMLLRTLGTILLLAVTFGGLMSLTR